MKRNKGDKKMSYVIMTDTSANLPEEIIEKYDVELIVMTYFIDNVEYKGYEKGKKTDLKAFYDKMRNKAETRTSLASPDVFYNAFENLAMQNKDIIYIGFSGGLSGNYQSSVIASEMIREKYPDIKLYTVDTLSASLGEGLLVYYACLMREEGKTIEEVRDWLENNKLKLCHWFTVDDLVYLKRGGRISATSAIAGTVLGIKPVMHVDNDGKLVAVSKVRGRKAALNALVNSFFEDAVDCENQIIGIAHADCEEDAQYVASEIKNKYNIKEIVMNYIDPVIGSHSGPGTLALFFMGNER